MPDLSPHDVLGALWQSSALSEAELGTAGLQQIELGDDRTCLPSSFHVGLAAQASIGMAALAASELALLRSGVRPTVSVPRRAAELESTAYFLLDGELPMQWARFSGLYPTADGHVRIHANFEHHRDGVLALLELGNASEATPEAVTEALGDWQAEAFETAAAERGLVVAKARTFAEWDAEHGTSGAVEPIRLTRIGDAPPEPLPATAPPAGGMAGLKVVEATRILAGPVCGRTLAAYGADVLLVNAPHLPNIAAIADTSRGKRTALADLRQTNERQAFSDVIRQSDVFVQGYRPGALAELGFGPDRLAALRPGIVCTALSAYGRVPAWANRRGFDSLVQTATGFNLAEAEAFDAAQPKAMPVQILDMASGFFMAAGTQIALLCRARIGGSWLVEVSLEETARWLRSLGRTPTSFSKVRLREHLRTYPCDYGTLQAMPHAARFRGAAASWHRPSGHPGRDPLGW